MSTTRRGFLGTLSAILAAPLAFAGFGPKPKTYAPEPEFQPNTDQRLPRKGEWLVWQSPYNYSRERFEVLADVAHADHLMLLHPGHTPASQARWSDGLLRRAAWDPTPPGLKRPGFGKTWFL